MRVEVLEDEDEVADRAAAIVAARVQDRTDIVLGLAAGTSPLPVYRRLVLQHRAGALAFADARAFLLDEYVGLPVGHPQRFAELARRELVGLVDLPGDRFLAPDVDARNLEAACEDYERAVIDASVGLQLLGVGRNGHIGFNEPGSPRDSRTRVVSLSSQTRMANAAAFDDPDDVPGQAITQGLATILEAAEIILIATGATKAEAVEAAVNGPVTDDCPASVLQDHPATTIVLDAAAAGGL